METCTSANPDEGRADSASRGRQRVAPYECNSDEREHTSQGHGDYKPQPSPVIASILRLVFSSACGVIFGFVVEKSRVFEPVNIRGQMVFKRILYGKFTMAAIAAGMFAMSLMAMLPSTHQHFQRVCNQFYGSFSTRGILSSLLGGLAVGTGMALAGSCPLLVYVQFGSLVPNSGYTVAGCLCGALMFALSEPLLRGFTQPVITASTNPWAKSSYFITALPLVAMFGILVFAFELLIPWQAEVKRVRASESLLSRGAWSPMVTGVIVGLLQLPLVTGANTHLAGAQTFSTLVTLLVGPVKRVLRKFVRVSSHTSNWGQVVFGVCAAWGAYTSADLSSSLGAARGVSHSHAFIGGLLLTFGAQLAGGATYTHGQTGMALLSILSFLTMGAIALSAVVTAALLKYYDIITPRSVADIL